MRRRGNCYITCEAIYHLLGGKEQWTPMNMRWEGDSHWFLKHTQSGVIVDPTKDQFRHTPDYSKAVGRGFLTKHPSRRARALMDQLLFQGDWVAPTSSRF